MKQHLSATLILSPFLLFGGTAALASDPYAGMTNDELAALRPTIVNASKENREAFRKEWQERVGQMSPEQRETFGEQPDNEPQIKEGCE